MGNGQGEPRTIEAVANDGKNTFTVGAPVWNHDPGRLRTGLSLYGREVRLIAPGVLRVPGKSGAYAFSVAAAPSPCLSDADVDHLGESIVEETLRRGGSLRNGRSVLAEMDKFGLGDDGRES